jgi:hypothetical protein
MVLREVDDEHARLGDEVGIELDATERRRRRVQRRLGQTEISHVEHRLRGGIQGGSGQVQVVGQVEVPHIVRRGGRHGAS